MSDTTADYWQTLLDAAVRMLANAPDDIDPTDYQMLLLAVRAIKVKQKIAQDTTSLPPMRMRYYPGE